MGDFGRAMEQRQTTWRLHNISDQRLGAQNGVSRPWILPVESWEEGLWSGIRKSLPAYINRDGARIQSHDGVHNLKSSWMLCANLYYPFAEAAGGLSLLAGFLRVQVHPEIQAVDRVELEYAEEPPLDPQSLLGEPVTGRRGAKQTSPDIGFIVTTSRGPGLVLTESKFTEHWFYECSGRQPRAENPDSGRCLNWASLGADIPGQCWQMQWEQGQRRNRQYWDHIRLSGAGSDRLKRCPAATGGYQLFRQQALAEAIAVSGKYSLVASCVAYDARNTDLVRCLRKTGVDDFTEDWAGLFEGSAVFSAWTHQAWVSWVRSSSQADQWGDWLGYVQQRYGYGEGDR